MIYTTSALRVEAVLSKRMLRRFTRPHLCGSKPRCQSERFDDLHDIGFAGSKPRCQGERFGDFHDVGFAGVKGRAVRASASVISTTSAFQGLEVKGQGSILASPALYKDEQNGAPSQSGVSRWRGSCECCGSVDRVGGAVVSA